MKRYLLATTLLAIPSLASAAISLTGSSTLWTPIAGNYDFLQDQQTGDAAGDIVGDINNPGFFTAFDDGGTPDLTDGSLGFRVRLDDHGGNTSNPDFNRNLWVGIDANNDGVIDAFVGVDRQGNSSTVGVYNPGSNENISPSTTSIDSTPYSSTAADVDNFDYRAVNVALDGGTTDDLTTTETGDTDYYVSFLVPLADLVSYLDTQGITIDQDSPLRYILATSTQHNSLNQDLGGLNGGNGSTDTWEDLGGFSPEVTPDGEVIPEPSIFSLFAAAGLLFLRRRRR